MATRNFQVSLQKKDDESMSHKDPKGILWYMYIYNYVYWYIYIYIYIYVSDFPIFSPCFLAEITIFPVDFHTFTASRSLPGSSGLATVLAERLNEEKNNPKWLLIFSYDNMFSTIILFSIVNYHQLSYDV